MTAARCALPVIDDRGARMCGALATTTRTVHDVELTLCATCAAVVDTNPSDPKARRLTPEEIAAAHDLDNLVHLARRRPAPKGNAKGRTVVRFDRSELKRLDVLRASLGWPSRAGIVRAFVHFGLDMVERTKPTTGGAT